MAKKTDILFVVGSQEPNVVLAHEQPMAGFPGLVKETDSPFVVVPLQELMGHKSVETTMIYTHVMDKGTNAVKSPLDIF